MLNVVSAEGKKRGNTGQHVDHSESIPIHSLSFFIQIYSRLPFTNAYLKCTYYVVNIESCRQDTGSEHIPTPTSTICFSVFCRVHWGLISGALSGCSGKPDRRKVFVKIQSHQIIYIHNTVRLINLKRN